MRKTLLAALSAILIMGVSLPFVSNAEAPSPSDRGAAWLEALELPESAHKLRQAGTSAEEVSEALEVLREARAPGDRDRASRRTARVLREEAEITRQHGPMEGLGAFVRSQVEAGVRGPELAQAIREHRGEERRGGRGEQQREQAQERRAEDAPGAGKAAGARPGKAEAGAQPRQQRQQLGAPTPPGAGRKAGERRQIGTPDRSKAVEQRDRRPAGRTGADASDDDDGRGKGQRGPARR